MLEDIVDEHIGLDHDNSYHSSENVDIFGTAYNIPVDNESYDSVLCTAVLEHLEEPQDALLECKRILKPGGCALYTIPFIWHIHEEPRDFYRYSEYGIRYLFRKSGLNIVELKALSGFWITFGQMFTYYLFRFNRGPIRWFKIIILIGYIIQGISFVLDKLDKAEKWTWMYLVVVRKPEA